MYGIKIAERFSSEATVFASILRHRPSDLDVRVLYHQDPADQTGPEDFANMAMCDTWTLDVGWRPNPEGSRGVVSKVLSQAAFRRSIDAITADAAKWKPDVIYSSQQGWDCFAASSIAQRLQIPQIIHLHYTLEKNPPKNPLRRHPNERITEVNGVIAISEFIRGDAISFGVPSEHVFVVRNSIDVPPLPDSSVRRTIRADIGIPDNAVLVGTVGRVEWWKGQEATLRAMTSPGFEHVWYLVVGDGSHLHNLQSLAAKLNLSDRVVFAGRRSDARQLLWSMDIFSHPSRNEPFGLAIAEACAAGLPVVAYAEGGAIEIVRHGKTGFLAGPDDTKGLANHLRALVESTDLRQQLGAQGRKDMEELFRPEAAGLLFGETVRSVLERD